MQAEGTFEVVAFDAAEARGGDRRRDHPAG